LGAGRHKIARMAGPKTTTGKRGKPPIPPDREYLVTWNPTRRSWDVMRDKVPTGGFAYDKDTAIGLAIREAQGDHANGLSAVVRSSLQDGKTKVEWSERGRLN
jgi:hypothetical protein